MMARTRQAGGKVGHLRGQVPVGIRMVSSGLRSVNLVRDSAAPGIGPVHVNARVQDTLGRLAAAIDDPSRTRAWSLTGSYGSGKSTVALLITALLGPGGNRRGEAEKLLAEANPGLAERITQGRDRIAAEGFITAITTARREPAVATLQRALTRGAQGRWPDGKYPRRVSASLKALRAHGADGDEALAALEALCREAPVLLIIDEFGKILEHLASDRGADGDDVYVLQEIAEAGAGPSGLPLYTLTLQHLSFLDYSAQSSAQQRREWAKVQGRFEDITFTPDLSDAVQLITRTIDQEGFDNPGRELVRRHGAASAAAWSQLGLQGVLPADAALFAALYPLHPLTAAAAPLVAAQVGQHDRSLAGFLASDEPSTVHRFLADHETAAATAATTVRLPELYDYFFTSGRTTMLASAAASRWIEIDLILSEAHGLHEQDLQILKTIGILNLIDAGGALRACPGTVLFALTDPSNEDVMDKDLHARLENLAGRGFLVYREFSDEYRIWRGSAIDLHSRVSEARQRCDDHAVVQMLARQLPAAVAAGRHSQRTGMLRHFITAATDSGTGALAGPGPDDPADGILVFHFGHEHDLPDVRSPLPVAAGTSKNAGAVLDAGREVMALEEVLSESGLDAVARREIIERTGQARAELAAVLAEAFSPSKPWARWLLICPPGREPRDVDAVHDPRVLNGQSLARIVSDACDRTYENSPHIRNEMLGRHQLTSQGAKARRALITAMLTQPSRPFLDITGYGPERAIYDGVVAYLGLHGPACQNRDRADTRGEYAYTEPRQDSTLAPAWAALRAELAKATQELSVDNLFRLLMAPPYGVKAGVVPIIVTTALIMGRSEIAVFEEGTYQPALTPDLMERLIKVPGRYSVKYAPATDGQRNQILERIAEALGMTRTKARPSSERNPALLSVTRELLGQVRGLTTYAAATQRLSERALAVRSVLKAARDPDELVFTTLPHVLGLPLIPVGAECNQDQAADFTRRLVEAVREIRGADAALRGEVTRVLAREFRLPDSIPDMRQALAARTAAFAEDIGEPELRGFISLALNDSLPDDEWLDPVAVRMVRAGLASWTDSHPRQFENAARRLARALDRVTHMYEPGISAAYPTDGQAQLVTVTGRDGHEERVLVHIPSTMRDTASQLAAEVAAIADDRLGADGRRILLAVLAQSLAAPQASGQGSVPCPADHSPA